MMLKRNVNPNKPWNNEQLIEYVRGYDGKKIGILFGGGDSPGANAVLQGVLDKADLSSYLVVAFKNGFWGIVQDPPVLTDALWNASLDLTSIGGTIIGSSRVNPAKVFFDGEGRIIEKKEFAAKTENREGYIPKAINFLGLDGMILSGGDNTLGAAYKLSQQGIPVVGIPKSIDDDYGKVYAYGRHTAVERAVKAIDNLRSTGSSHERDLVLEVMGRKCGRIALEAGIATHADIILIPEFLYNLETVLGISSENRRKGQKYNVHIVSEGAVPIGGDESLASQQTDGYGEKIRGGAGKKFADALSAYYRKNGFGDDIVRDHKVGHEHRSGTPAETDRVRGYRYGVGAMQLVVAKKWGYLVGYSQGEYITVPLENATVEKRVSEKEYDPQRHNVRLETISLETIKSLK